MSNRKIIVVFGATGAQGGGLVQAILNDAESEFAVRAVTRDTQSDKAKELAGKGAELVEADIDDVESIKLALKGAYGAYFVTFFWTHFSPGKEMEEAKNMARAAKEANLQHVIWSTLEDTREYIPLSDSRMPTLIEKYKVPHFDGKGAANQYFTDFGVPTTFLLTSFYWDNFIHFGMGPKKGPDGNLILTLPLGDKKIASIAAEDIGKCAYGIFKDGATYINKMVGISGELLSGNEFAAKLTKGMGVEVKYEKINFDTYRSLGFPGADDLGNMFQFFHDFEEELNSKRSVAFSKKLNHELKTFDEWLNENAAKIPVT